jgi:hypothetical protein
LRRKLFSSFNLLEGQLRVIDPALELVDDDFILLELAMVVTLIDSMVFGGGS